MWGHTAGPCWQGQKQKGLPVVRTWACKAHLMLPAASGKPEKKARSQQGGWAIASEFTEANGLTATRAAKPHCLALHRAAGLLATLILIDVRECRGLRVEPVQEVGGVRHHVVILASELGPNLHPGPRSHVQHRSRAGWPPKIGSRGPNLSILKDDLPRPSSSTDAVICLQAEDPGTLPVTVQALHAAVRLGAERLPL